MPRFIPRQRKHKARLRDAPQSNNSDFPPSSQNDKNVDSNAFLLPTPSAAEKESNRLRLKLRSELRSDSSKISSKKQKRLDKYIETKLKKEENAELLRKLSEAEKKGEVDRSALWSSRVLGKRKRNLGELVGQGQREEGGRRERGAGKRGGKEERGSEDEDMESEDSFQGDGLLAATSNGFSDVHMERDQPPRSKIVVGSGLRQPLQIGSDGLPVIPSKTGVQIDVSTEDTQDSEGSWEGLSDGTGDDEDERETHLTAMLLDEDDDEESSDESGSDGTRSSDSHDDIPTHESRSRIVPRTSAFKTWATQQINNSLGHVPMETTDYLEMQQKLPVPDKTTLPAPPANHRETEQKPQEVRKAFAVQVTRPPELEEARLQLPILAEEQKIMEAIHNNPWAIIWGATGSGKTTQLPQFLFEAGYGSPEGPTPGMIGITQPRRVAAVSMAKRVSEEMGEHAAKVAYQIRFENTASKDTAIKFMTDGILVREIAQDFALLRYSIIIIDEAHERSVNTDILIGMLTRIVRLRQKMSAEDHKIQPLKLVIMSATLRVSDFLKNASLFSQPPPLVQAEGRQFPVTIHFARRTHPEYLEQVFRKVCHGHRKLPPGGMLVFLTGQSEIKTLLKRLRDRFASTDNAHVLSKVQFSASDGPLEIDDVDFGGTQVVDNDEDSELEFYGHDGDDVDDQFVIGETETFCPTRYVHLLPLYSQLPTKEQLRVFDSPPPESRLIVLATNVAETSLTIPGIRYVFDCGRSKERVYHQGSGVQKFEVGWISKAAAEQRAGRAGRTGPGHCYRLYSSAVFEGDFAEHADPEILRTPIEGVVLQMKAMGLDNIVNFPFPSPPSRESLASAERLLRNLGAISTAGQMTQLGHSLSIYPLSPKYGKMLAIGSQHGCLPYIVAIVCGLAVADVFIPESQIDMKPIQQQEDEVYTNLDRLEDTAREERRKAYTRSLTTFSRQDPTSDILKLLSAVCAHAYADSPESFCAQMFLRHKALTEISHLRRQLTAIITANHSESIGQYNPHLQPPSPKQVKAINQIVAAGFIDQVAIRADMSPNPPASLTQYKPKRAIDVPYLPLTPLTSPTEPENGNGGVIYIHPSSILSRLPPKSLPQYLIYSHLQESSPQSTTTTTNSTIQDPKIRLHPLTTISGTQLSALAYDTPLLTYGKPVGKIEMLPRGTDGRERREVWVVPFLRAVGIGGGEAGAGVGTGSGVGWPLPGRKVLQRRAVRDKAGGGSGSGWVEERGLS